MKSLLLIKLRKNRNINNSPVLFADGNAILYLN